MRDNEEQYMARRKKSRVIVGVSVAILVALGAAVFLFRGEGGRAIAVEYIRPQRRTIVETITANGRIRPEVMVKISPEVSGEVTELPIVEGQLVKKGDLLCRIKPDSYISYRERAAAAVQSSKAQAAQANAGYLQQKLNLERMAKLYRDSAVSPADLERAQTECKVAESQLSGARYAVASAEASLREAEQSLLKTAIYAPLSATVSKLSVELGERVVGTAQMAGTEIMRLANLERMEAWVEVSESDVVRIHGGDTAVVHVDSYPDTTFLGVITHIANTAEDVASKSQVTSFEVRIRLLPESYKFLVKQEGESPFKPGMSVSVDIQAQRVDNAISVPIECVTLRRGDEKRDEQERQEVVFVLCNDTARMVNVRTGIQSTDYIHIVSGVTDSTRVIVAPYDVVSKTLKDGDLVHATLSEKKNDE